MLGRSNTSKANVPPGALISFLQKGLQYVGIEETLRQDGSDRILHNNNNSNNNNINNSASSSVVNGQQMQQEILNFTLLSPHSIQALTRKNPPIQINVPPATAAAAIKAKLESEANNVGAAINSTTSGTTTTTTTTHNNIAKPGTSYKNNNVVVTNNAHEKDAQDRYRQTKQAGRILDGRLSTTTTTKVAGYGQEHHPMHLVGAVPPPPLPHQQQQQQHMMGRAMATGPQERHNMYMNDNLTEQTKAAAVALASINTPSGDMSNAGFQSLKSVVSKEIGSTMSSSVPLFVEKIDEERRKEEDYLTRAKPEEVLELNKHTSEVFMCAWNPVFTDLLATGSGDASARIWKMAGKDAKKGSDVCRLLQHGTNPLDQKNKDVTTLEWSSNGELLATGSYDGVARVWSRTGAIVHTLRGHIGPIFSLRWNKSGKFLLSGSYDKTAIVWDVSGETGEIKQQFMHHTAPALDVDWKDDLTFASCSTDKTVLICKVGVNAPLHRFVGHEDEVNAVKWDPSGSLLASCSDDFTAKVWDLSRGNANPLYDFRSHKLEIYTLKWYVLVVCNVVLFVFIISVTA
jgi:FOG: WD40 repeat